VVVVVVDMVRLKGGGVEGVMKLGWGWE
jgi:hypothetical protein